ncbi:cation transporting ATPase C-terminal domain-containing protein [Streptococcus iniae]
MFTVGLFRNKLFNYSIPVAFVALMVTVVVPGFNQFFHVAHLSMTQWLVTIIGSLLMVVLVEAVKAVQRAMGKDEKKLFKSKKQIPKWSLFLSFLEWIAR